MIIHQVRTICSDYGIVCIRREGQDVEKIISDDGILNEYKVTREFDSFPFFVPLNFEPIGAAPVECIHVHILSFDFEGNHLKKLKPQYKFELATDNLNTSISGGTSLGVFIT